MERWGFPRALVIRRMRRSIEVQASLNRRVALPVHIIDQFLAVATSTSIMATEDGVDNVSPAVTRRSTLRIHP